MQFLLFSTVSDDNSSIQSSPWQRDHNWKQLSPHKNISSDLTFHYYRPFAIILSESSKLVSKYLQRQPCGKRKLQSLVQYEKRNLQKTFLSKVNRKQNENKLDEIKVKHEEVQDSEDTVDNSKGKTSKKLNDYDDNEKMDFTIGDERNSKLEETLINDIKISNSKETNQFESMKQYRKKRMQRTSKLSSVIERLISKVSEKPMNVTSTQTGLGIHFSTSSKSNELFFPHQHVSPRKRILREFEKVSLEDRNSTTKKRSRSKSNASTDLAAAGNSKTLNSNYSIVVAHHTASIACNTKEEQNRIANGSPPKNVNQVDAVLPEKTLKNSRSTATATISKNSHAHSNEISSQAVSKPISNYSIISLLGHNNPSSSDSKNEVNTDDRTVNENRGSPRSPLSYNHQISNSSRSTYGTKKKSPTNSGSALVNSPTNYRNARSPEINSPSPGLQHNSQLNRYHPASLSSPTSSFHPYLPSRASPLSSGTLSPTDSYRHRSYRTTGSPSTVSNSSVGGMNHQHASLNGSPTAFANRYSPSTYTTSTKTSPPHVQSSQPYHHLLPQPYDVNTTSVSENQHRSSDWSPARSSTISGPSSPSNYANNSLSTTTIPKKTASIRQKYGSLSPNGFNCGNNSETTLSTRNDSSSAKKSMIETITDTKIKRSRSPSEQHKKPQSQELFEKDMQARYNADLAARHHQSLIASALQQQAANPYYHMSGYNNIHAPNIPSSMAAAAVYMNPLYYHHSASELFRKTHPAAAMDLLHKNIVPSWIDPYNSMLHYPAMSGSGLIPDNPSLTVKSQSDPHSMLMSPYSLSRTVPGRDPADVEMWNASDAKKSPVTSSVPIASTMFRRQPQQFSDCEPISLIKDEPSSGK